MLRIKSVWSHKRSLFINACRGGGGGGGGGVNIVKNKKNISIKKD